MNEATQCSGAVYSRFGRPGDYPGPPESREYALSTYCCTQARLQRLLHLRKQETVVDPSPFSYIREGDGTNC